MQPQQDRIWCNAIQDRMNRLYKIDGRDNKEHPQHGTYTGLWEKFNGLSRVQA